MANSTDKDISIGISQESLQELRASTDKVISEITKTYLKATEQFIGLMQDEVAKLRIQIDVLEQENRDLKSEVERNQSRVGCIVLIIFGATLMTLIYQLVT